MDYEPPPATTVVQATPVVSQPTVVAASVVLAANLPGATNTGEHTANSPTSPTGNAQTRQEDRERSEVTSALQDGDKMTVFCMKLMCQPAYRIIAQIFLIIGAAHLSFESLNYFLVEDGFDIFIFEMIRWVYWPGNFSTSF